MLAQAAGAWPHNSPAGGSRRPGCGVVPWLCSHRLSKTTTYLLSGRRLRTPRRYQVFGISLMGTGNRR
jgi:hypothetical protein